MAFSELPADGELNLGPVTLPAGKRVTAAYGSGEPIAWATNQPLRDAGTVWAALSAAHPETGLVPILLAGLDDDTKRPWDDEEFDDPENISALDHLDAARVLADDWADGLEELELGEEEDAGAIEQRAPFGPQFPGLAPPQDTSLSPARLREALAALPPARLGLVAAERPADVLPRIGWGGVVNWHDTPLPIAAVLRSWEDRFGARLLEVGFAQIRLLVERPPRSPDAARPIAAEHYAFCDECGGRALSDVASITASLVNAPVWTFWWD
jgi:Domain of unknown function (DUF4253)